jgi:hypothetical protein
MYAASGGLAVAVVAVVVGVLLHGVGAGTRTAAESGSASSYSGSAAVPAAGSAPLNRAESSGTAGCSTAQLKADLAEAVRKGASVIVGYGTLTSGATAVHGAGSDAPDYYSLTLRSVRTLAGPTVTPGSIAWIAGANPAAGTGASSGSTSATARQPTFAPGGELFGIVSPSAAAGAPGPVLQAALVANGQVVLSGAGCWDITIPASGSRQGLAGTSGQSGSAQSGAPVVTRVPLATAEKFAAAAGKE